MARPVHDGNSKSRRARVQGYAVGTSLSHSTPSKNRPVGLNAELCHEERMNGTKITKLRGSLHACIYNAYRSAQL